MDTSMLATQSVFDTCATARHLTEMGQQFPSLSSKPNSYWIFPKLIQILAPLAHLLGYNSWHCFHGSPDHSLVFEVPLHCTLRKHVHSAYPYIHAHKRVVYIDIDNWR